MKNRTMIKIDVGDNAFFLQTVSKDFHSLHGFCILKKEIQDLDTRKELIIRDMCSYAVLRIKKEERGTIFQVEFTWLQDSGDGTLTGRQETVCFSYQYLCHILSKKGVYKQLSIPKVSRPKIEFDSLSNLKRVVENPLLRSKLGRFLNKHLNWVDYQRIVLIDDFVPYSFLFTSYTQYGAGVCGGVILHDQDNLAKAYYSIHT